MNNQPPYVPYTPASGYPPEPPPVLVWYRVYAALMALVYLLCVAGGIAMVAFRDVIADESSPAIVYLIQGTLLGGMGAVFAVAFIAAFFLPRARWAWVYHIVLIALGMTSCCTIPACVPLLIFFIKPETQEYFRG
jgi:hypothetical protein